MQSCIFSFALFACVALLNVSPSLALTEFDTDRLTIPRSEILSGGPGKDGNPALIHPRTIPVGEAGDFASDERVVVVRLVLAASKDGRTAVLEQPANAQVVHTFWFAWATLQPDTEIYAPHGRR